MRAAHVLALNSGSSSLKFGLFRVDAPEVRPLLLESLRGYDPDAGAESSMNLVRNRLIETGLPAPEIVGHRIVHGGPELSRPCLIDAKVQQQLEAAIPFAPMHLPAALALITRAQACFPALPQVACFDTHFHADLPERAWVLPLPRELQADGVRRYGFHGLSCESIVRQLGRDLPERLVIAHLGQGSSITAVREGRSIDTSMGLTPSGGMIMGTRTGDLDPGVLIDLLRRQRLDAAGLEDLVNRRSGLLGISGLSGDMRRLHEASAQHPGAALAIDMFCYSARKQIAAMIAVLGGIDALVFTGGIGENDAAVRAGICAGLACFGIAPDQVAGGPASPVRVEVRATREEEQIALHAAALLAKI